MREYCDRLRHRFIRSEGGYSGFCTRWLRLGIGQYRCRKDSRYWQFSILIRRHVAVRLNPVCRCGTNTSGNSERDAAKPHDCGPLSLRLIADSDRPRKIGSIEKRLLAYKGDHNSEYPADIANLATIEFAAHRIILSARPRRPRRAEKMKRQSRFKTLASILQRHFIPESACDRDMFRNGSTGRNPFQILLHSGISAQKVSKLKPEVRIRPNSFIFP